MIFRMVRDYGRTVLAVAEMSFRWTMTESFVIFTIFIQPMIIALLAMWILRDKGSEYAMFVVVGSGMTGLWSGLLFICGNSVNVERWTGTLETLVGMPTPLEVVVFGKCLANISFSLLAMVLSYILAAFFFGYSLSLTQPWLFAGTMILTVFSFISFGLILAPVFVMNPSVQQWQNGLEFPVYILSGFLFPIALLPEWTTPFSYLLPPYWAARALHGTSSGNVPIEETLLNWGILLAFSLVYYLLAGVLFKKMLVKVRVDATLDMQ
jgi:ABC-2 type transport system permease protein